MPKGKLSPEGEVIAAYGAAMVAAFQVLINCLEENDALLPGQFPDALALPRSPPGGAPIFWRSLNHILHFALYSFLRQCWLQSN
jgi:hypothetical protein